GGACFDTEVIAVDVRADLDAGCRDEEDRRVEDRRAVTLALEARVLLGLHDGIAIPAAHAPRERYDLLVRHAALAKRSGAFSNLGDGVHDDADDRTAVGLRLLDGPPSELSADALVGVQRLDLDLLLGVEAIADLLVVGLLRPSVS